VDDGLGEAAKCLLRFKARPKARLPVPSDQCVQRADQGQLDCVKKRDPRRDVDEIRIR
jgi:hypothetical protein